VAGTQAEGATPHDAAIVADACVDAARRIMTELLALRAGALSSLRVRWTMRFHRMLIGSVSTVLLLSGILAAWPEEVPVLDLNPICRGIAEGAAGAGERGGPDLSFAKCVRSEQAIRKRLVKTWSKYAPDDRQDCMAETTMGGLASYTNLLGCLKSAGEAHKMFPGRNRPYRIEQ
jgi:hypothetical protein